jgi:uncharacterized protein YgiM (DUF1202 family)
MIRWLICSLALCCAACTPAAQRPAATEAPLPAAVVSTIEGTFAPPVLVPTATLTPTAISSARCPNAPPSQLIVHERGRVTRNNQRLNLREGPGTEYRVLTLLEEGQIFFVLSGPACSGDFAWFQVQARGRIGWIAEGDAAQYYAEPYLTG